MVVHAFVEGMPPTTQHAQLQESAQVGWISVSHRTLRSGRTNPAFASQLRRKS